MFCTRKFLVDPKNREHVRRMNTRILQRKHQFVAGEGDDVLKGWCADVTVDKSFLVLNDVILNMTRMSGKREYQEHSELRFYNTPFAAFVNESTNHRSSTRSAVEVEEE